MSDYRYDAVVASVHDGDTVNLDVDLGFGTWIKNRPVRMFGINAPELNTAEGKAAKDFIVGILPPGMAVILDSIKDRPDKYGGRYLGTVLVPVYEAEKPATLKSVNQMMIDSGHAKPWDGKGDKPV